MSLSYGSDANNLIKIKKALPICGNIKLAFSNIEIIYRSKKNKKKILILLKFKSYQKR